MGDGVSVRRDGGGYRSGMSQLWRNPKSSTFQSLKPNDYAAVMASSLATTAYSPAAVDSSRFQPWTLPSQQQVELGSATCAPKNNALIPAPEKATGNSGSRPFAPGSLERPYRRFNRATAAIAIPRGSEKCPISPNVASARIQPRRTRNPRLDAPCSRVVAWAQG
jgi:hypothetical protein